MRKPLLIAVALIVLLAACSKSKEGNLTLGGTSASPGATTAAGAKATAAPKATSKGGSTTTGGGSSTSSGSKTSQATPKPAPPGGSNPPQDGTYTYTVSGNSTNPQTGPQTYKDQIVTAKISHSGDVYSTEQSTNQGTNTSRNQWTSTKVLFLSVKIESPYGTFQCTYNPPLTIAKFPTKPETYPQQQLKGTGNACGGTLDISILRKENVADASGHSWSSWVVHVKIDSSFKYNGSTIETKSDEMRWVSPDLGVQVKSVADSSSSTPFGKATGHATTLLKSHP